MHWTSDELIEALYGVREPNTHLEACAACAGRWEALRRARPGLRTAPQRIERRQPRMRPAMPALAVAAMVLAGVLLLRPVPRPEPSIAQGGEGQLYMEIYEQVVASEEPRAAAPIRGLFEDRVRFEDR